MVKRKKALICGISGQDGSYLAELLVGKGYAVVGTSRDAEGASFTNLVKLGLRDLVRCRSMSLQDFRSVIQVIVEEEPDEIYNLSAQSSVSLSFAQPVQTLDSITVGIINLLEAIRLLKSPLRLYNAASSECYGELDRHRPATESMPFRPKSPYGIAKAAAFWLVANYRDAYGLHACSGILFNHESTLRPARFVTRKVVQAACGIAAGSRKRLAVGNIQIVRDWGWAPEYVEAMWMMLQADTSHDYIIATGESLSLEEFIAGCFAEFSLDWREHTDMDDSLFRPNDIIGSFADPALAKRQLGWSARTRGRALISCLVAGETATVAAP